MENNKFYASYSKIDTYKSCPQGYKYSYIDNLEPKIKKRSQYVGTHIHKLVELFYVQRTPELLEQRLAYASQLANMINTPTDPEGLKEYKEDCKEAYGNTLTWRQYLAEVIQEEFNELSEDMKNEVGLTYIQDLAYIMAQYEYYYSNDNLVMLDIEHKKYCGFGRHNNRETILPFICDGIVRLPNDKIYIVEHKTYSKDPMTFEDTWLNTQTAIYVSALRAQGWDIEGVLWDNIKSVSPKAPNVLKNGSYGKQTSNVTLFSFIDYGTIMLGPDAVIEAINNLPQEVKELGVEGNKDNFLSRHITVFNEQVVDEMLADTSRVLEELTKDKPLIYRNLGWTCNNCSFKPLCRAQMLGENPELVKSTLFKSKEN